MTPRGRQLIDDTEAEPTVGSGGTADVRCGRVGVVDLDPNIAIAGPELDHTPSVRVAYDVRDELGHDELDVLGETIGQRKLPGDGTSHVARGRR